MTGNNGLQRQSQTMRKSLDRSSLSGKRIARELLLLCTTSSMSPERKERISQILKGTVNWQYLLDLMELHGIASLIAYNLSNGDFTCQIPQPYVDKLNQIYNNTLYRNVVISNELARILSAFNQHGVDVLPLKGTVLAEVLYGNPALRSVTDIDVLVNQSNMDQARHLLKELGYKQVEMPPIWVHYFHDAPYRKEGKFPLVVELHWDLADRKLVAVAEQEIWRRAQPLKLQGVSTKILSPEDNLLYLSNNFSKQKTQILKSLADISELLKKYEGILDWNYIMGSARSWQIEPAVYFSLKLVKDLLGISVPESILAALKPALWRRRAIEFLISRRDLISPIRSVKLRNETSAVVHSLMMKHVSQMSASLSKHRGTVRRAAWLRTAIWIILVFGTSLIRNAVRLLCRSGWL
jgi:hypothetical protein